MGTIVPKNEDRDDEEYRETYEKYTIVQPGDIMINGLNLNYDFNSLRVGYVPADGIITSAYVVLRPNKGVKTRYYTYLLKAFDDRKFFHGMGRGVRLTLSYRELAKYEIPIPPLPEQDEIVSYLDDKCGKIDKIVSRIELEISKLKELKRSLINEVVTGQRPIK
jgi:type I restriction enzyme S subunit